VGVVRPEPVAGSAFGAPQHAEVLFEPADGRGGMLGVVKQVCIDVGVVVIEACPSWRETNATFTP